MTKRLLATLLALVMLCALLPTTALAAEGAADEWVVTELTPCQYDSVELRPDGLVKVTKDGNYGPPYGLVDQTGEIVPWEYAIGDFCCGFALVTDRSNKWGFIDRTGREVVPCKYNNVGAHYQADILEGFVPVRGENLNWGFVNMAGKEVVPCRYNACYDGGKNTGLIEKSVSEGLAAVRGENLKWGFVNMAGEEVVPCQYDSVHPFSEGLAAVWMYGYGYGFIDKTGQEVIPCRYEATWDFSEGLAAVEDEDNKWGFIDKAGQEVIPCRYDAAGDFSDGFARVVVGENWSSYKYGLVDKTGKEIAPCKYDYMDDFTADAVRVQLDGKYGLVDKTGQEVVPPGKYDDMYYFMKAGVAEVELKFKCGFVNATGEEIVPCKYDEVVAPSEGLARVCLGYPVDATAAYGFADVTTGQEVIPCQYGSVGSFSGGLAAVWMYGYGYGLIDKTGQEVVPCAYEDVKYCGNGLVAVKKDDKFGFLTISKGNWPPRQPQTGRLFSDSGESVSWSVTGEGQVAVDAADLASEEAILVGCYDQNGQFTGVKVLDAQTATAQLDPATPNVKLFWLGAKQNPLAPSVTVWGK